MCQTGEYDELSPNFVGPYLPGMFYCIIKIFRIRVFYCSFGNICHYIPTSYDHTTDRSHDVNSIAQGVGEDPSWQQKTVES